MQREIEKIDISRDTQFNKIDVARSIRMLSLKMNELIDAVNDINILVSGGWTIDDDDEDVLLDPSDIDIDIN